MNPNQILERIKNGIKHPIFWGDVEKIRDYINWLEDMVLKVVSESNDEINIDMIREQYCRENKIV